MLCEEEISAEEKFHSHTDSEQEEEEEEANNMNSSKGDLVNDSTSHDGRYQFERNYEDKDDTSNETTTDSLNKCDKTTQVVIFSLKQFG